MQANTKVHLHVYSEQFHCLVVVAASFHYLLVLFLWCVRAPSNLIPRLNAFHLISFVCLWADTIYKYLSLVSRREEGRRNDTANFVVQVTGSLATKATFCLWKVFNLFFSLIFIKFIFQSTFTRSGFRSLSVYIHLVVDPWISL